MNGDKDSTTEYAYDANGNMTFDYNKKITIIQYNALNLPYRLQFTYGHTTDYFYDAAGSKLSVADTTVNTNLLVPMGKTVPVQAGNVLTTMKTDYCGDIIYEDGVLSNILTEEGYVTLSGSTAVFHYYLKDHEGNNRVALNQNGTVEQVNNYYPFGGLYGDNTGGSTQPYMYNGKELDRMHGLDLFDYGARHYDAALGRWFTPDPLGEKDYSVSPYVYCSNDAVKNIDPDGRYKIIALDENEKKNIPIIIAAKKYPKDDNAIHIWAHGTPHSIIVYTKKDGTKIIRTPEEFGTFLNRNCKLWRNRSPGEDILIVLHCCETGLEFSGITTSIARMISAYFGITVIAPNANDAVDDHLNLELGSYTSKKVMMNGEYVDVRDAISVWNQFFKGEQTNSYVGYWAPLEETLKKNNDLWEKVKKDQEEKWRNGNK